MSEMSPEQARDPLRRMEWRGARLALVARCLIIGVMGTYLGMTVAYPAAFWPLGFVAFFFGTTLAHGWLARRHPDKVMWPLLIILLESAALAVVVAFPNPISGFDLPVQYPFRTSFFVVIILYVVSTAFSYRALFPLGAGISCALVWGSFSVWINERPDTVNFSSFASVEEVTRDSILNLIAQPTFFAFDDRRVEIIAIVLTGLLVAALVARSRWQVRRILKAEAERQQAQTEQSFIRETFGRYVPDSVVTTILEDRGRLLPKKRVATILFADIEGFTALGDRLDAEGLLTVLNAYFDEVGQAIAENGGTITQFQGDAILAGFNVPVSDANHADDAIAAAKAILDRVNGRDFQGEKLNVRIGIHTGEVVAGSVGGGARLTFTVHGTAVNVAARLAQLNKDTGTRLLISAATLKAAQAAPPAHFVGSYPLPGLTTPVEVGTLSELLPPTAPEPSDPAPTDMGAQNR